jgi:ribonuclease HII
MTEQSKIFPNYSFEKHVGYGTAAHSAALKIHGICALHRQSFKPINKFLVDRL